jgi:alpha-glucosidase
MFSTPRTLAALLVSALVSMPATALAAASAADNDASSSPSSSAVILDRVDSAQALPNGMEIKSGKATLRVTALTDDILRVEIAPEGAIPEHHSWAVLPDAAKQPAGVTADSDASGEGFRTKSLKVRVERSPLRLVISDLEGHVLDADDAARPVEFHGASFRVHKSMPFDEHFFGLGDKMGPLDRRNEAFTLWNTDAYHFQESTDPLYKSIPFFLATRGALSYGIFLDDTWRSSFDFGKETRDAYSFGAEGGPLDYYFLAGPEPKQVISRYTELTGRPPLPPLWTLGFQQCRYSYYPESQVREIANHLRADHIPADTIYLDIDYQEKYRPFTINREYFPHFEQMIADLRRQHFHVITITDLHIADAPGIGYKPYDSGVAGDHFVKNPDGSTFVGIVWPGKSVFPDFTRKVTRDWWGTLYSDFYVKDGVSGFWNDMNEPSVFDGPDKTMPLDTVHRIAEPGWPERSTSHREVHNIFGMQNSRATYDGLLALKPNERPFVLTRASYAGGQRYAATWSGDNSSTWNHMRESIPQLLSLSMSGFSMVGDDIGGYAGNAPPDLLTRWYELGAFNPIDRNHTETGGMHHEAWTNGPMHEAIRRRYIEERYHLLPYLYTLAEEASTTGIPMMRPLFFEFPKNDPVALAPDSEFMLGPSLMVAPRAFPETEGAYPVVFPPNTAWYDYWTGKAVHAEQPPPGPVPAPPVQTLQVDPKLDTLPVYVRAGSILPRQPLIEDTDEKPQGPLELRVYPGPDCQGSLYLDDGISFSYRKGEYLKASYTCNATAQGVEIKLAREGSYQPWWQEAELKVYGAPHAPKNVTVNGQKATAKFDAASQTVIVRVPDQAAGESVVIEY